MPAFIGLARTLNGTASNERGFSSFATPGAEPIPELGA
jgi:hypothetical protein